MIKAFFMATNIILTGILCIWGLFMSDKSATSNSAGEMQQTAIFAGGCFWCLEPPFEHLDGVQAVLSGYTGGHVKNPTYHQVSSGTTGHYEAIKVVYDPQKVTYEKLVETFWKQIDPTDAGGQFVDRGSQYHTAIFYADNEQKEIATKSKEQLEKSGKFDKPIVTEILPLTEF